MGGWHEFGPKDGQRRRHPKKSGGRSPGGLSTVYGIVKQSGGDLESARARRPPGSTESSFSTVPQVRYGRSMQRFTWYELKTTDREGAADFYSALLGWRCDRTSEPRTFRVEDQAVGALTVLPPSAQQAGVPCHWLGHIRVEDLDQVKSRMEARGSSVLVAEPADPPEDTVVMKDAYGAVFAITTIDREPSDAVVWHELHTKDSVMAWVAYGVELGWKTTDSPLVNQDIGRYAMFAWGREGALPSAGALIETARLPGVHAHWAYHFACRDIDVAAERVTALGGNVVQGPLTLPTQVRAVYCEDPQGAVFVLQAMP